MDIIPKGNYYLRYIKGKKKKNMDYPNWMVNVVRNDLEVSVREAVDAIEMYMLTVAGQMELSDMLQKYGVEVKQLKSVGLYFESDGKNIRTIAWFKRLHSWGCSSYGYTRVYTQTPL